MVYLDERVCRSYREKIKSTCHPPLQTVNLVLVQKTQMTGKMSLGISFWWYQFLNIVQRLGLRIHIGHPHSQVLSIFKNSCMVIQMGHLIHFAKRNMSSRNSTSHWRTWILLEDEREICIEEDLTILLSTLCHDTHNRILVEHLQRSGETISRHFNLVLKALCRHSGHIIKQRSLDKLLQTFCTTWKYYIWFEVSSNIGTRTNTKRHVDKYY